MFYEVYCYVFHSLDTNAKGIISSISFSECSLLVRPEPLLDYTFHFLVDSLQFSMHKIRSSTNRHSFTFSFLNDVYFFSCPVALATASSTSLNRSAEGGQPCLVPDLRGKAFSLLPLSRVFAVGFTWTHSGRLSIQAEGLQSPDFLVSLGG